MPALRAFLSGIVDYAGLFPPAKLSMREAVENYAAYREGSDNDLLGRFVVPATRIAEFAEEAETLFPRGEGAEPWRLSAIVSGDIASAKKALLEFNCGHWTGSVRGHATVDAVEISAPSQPEIRSAASQFPGFFQTFIEVAADRDPAPLIDAVGEAGACAKIRTGGILPDSFPTASTVVRFIAECHRRGVKFKATAGLHHPLRASYPLTYESGSASAPMFGFLNLFLAAALIHSGFSEGVASEMLEERDPHALSFGSDGIDWRGNHISTSELLATRNDLALSFGSCSFLDPVNEAKKLGYL